MTTIRVNVETRTESWTEDYELEPSEQAAWDRATPERREKMADDIAEQLFINTCSYGREIIE